MLPPPVVLVTVKSTGKKYIFMELMKNGKVRTFGEVLFVHGVSSQHGPEKVFLRNSVTIGEEQDRTEEVLLGLQNQHTERAPNEGR